MLDRLHSHVSQLAARPSSAPLYATQRDPHTAMSKHQFNLFAGLLIAGNAAFWVSKAALGNRDNGPIGGGGR